MFRLRPTKQHNRDVSYYCPVPLALPTVRKKQRKDATERMRLSRDGDGRDTGLVLSNSPLDLLVLAVVSPLVLSLGNKDVVLVDLSFLDLGLSAGQGAEVTTALETFRGDESLDLGTVVWVRKIMKAKRSGTSLSETELPMHSEE